MTFDVSTVALKDRKLFLWKCIRRVLSF